MHLTLALLSAEVGTVGPRRPELSAQGSQRVKRSSPHTSDIFLLTLSNISTHCVIPGASEVITVVWVPGVLDLASEPV